MEEILENWRRFEERLLIEKRAPLRFPNLKSISNRPETNLQVLDSERKKEIYKRKVLNKIIRSYKKAVEVGEIPADEVKRDLSELAELADQKVSETEGLVFTINFLGDAIEDVTEGMAKSFDSDGPSPKMPYKKGLLKGIFSKAWRFAKKKIRGNADQKIKHGKDLESTKEHEAVHFVMSEVREQYGREAFMCILKMLLNAYSEESFKMLKDFIQFLSESYTFKSGEDFEEILTFTYSILSSDRIRKLFKAYLEQEKGITGEQKREVINNLKSHWKEVVAIGEELTEEKIKKWCEL